MASTPNHVEKFIPYTQLVKKKGMWREVIASRMQYAQHLIANEYNVDPDRVRDIFLRAWDKSTKDYPSPKYAQPQNSREFEAFNEYILYLWEYYVEDTTKRNKPPKEPNAPKEDKPTVDDGGEDSPPENKSKSDSEDPGAIVIVEQKQENNNQDEASSERMYDGVRGEDLVDEEIDERILRLLGIEDVFDIDYDTYKTLLREKMAAGRMSNSQMPTEEVELLTDEFKRVKRKVGRFKVNKKRSRDTGDVSSSLSAVKGFIQGAPPPQQKLLAPADDSKDKKKSLEENVAAIRKTVESILELMENQFSTIRKQLELDRRKREKQTRGSREDRLESGIKKTVALARKVLAPVFNLLDRIIKFITTVLIGRALVKLLEWISDKKNQKKLNSLGRFFKDWWPAILSAFVLFATPLGNLIRFVLGTLAKMTLTIAKKGIPALLKFIGKNPYIAAAVAVGTGAFIASQMNESNRDKLAEDDPNIVKPGEKDRTPSPSQLQSEEVMQRGLNLFSGGGRVPGYSGGGKTTGPSRRTQNDGGKITGSTGKRVRGAGKDTQLIVAQPGEVVISKKAVDKFGAPFFLNLNKMGGGTNIPKFSKYSDLQFAQGGGQIGVNIDSIPLDVRAEGRRIGTLNYNTILNNRSHSEYEKVQREQSGHTLTDYINNAIQDLLDSGWRKPISERSAEELMWDSSKNGIQYRESERSTNKIPQLNIRPSGSSNNKITASGVMGSSGGELGDIKKSTPMSQRTSAPFVGKLIPIESKNKAQVTPLAKVGVGGQKQTTPPPPPDKNISIISTKTKSKSKASSTPSPKGDREIENFDAFMPTESRMQNIAIYGLVGVE